MEFNFSYTVFYEDEYLLIVNKPAGMLVHPTVKEDGSTLYNYVAHYYKQQGLLHNIHPVSRLDRNTSGLVIFAKEPRIQFLLSQQEVIKKYLGIVTGTLPADSGIIEAPIARKEGSIIERCVSPNGKYARTDYKLISRRGNISVCWNCSCTLAVPTRYAYIWHISAARFIMITFTEHQDRKAATLCMLITWALTILQPVFF